MTFIITNQQKCKHLFWCFWTLIYWNYLSYLWKCNSNLSSKIHQLDIKKIRTLLVISRRARDMHSSCYTYAIPFFYRFHRKSFIRRYTTICLSNFEQPFLLKLHECSINIQKGEKTWFFCIDWKFSIFKITLHLDLNSIIS